MFECNLSCENFLLLKKKIFKMHTQKTEIIWTTWAIDNEPAKHATVQYIANMARNPLSIDHARARAREIAKDWPEFIPLLKKELNL